jgi:hypothetical protein
MSLSITLSVRGHNETDTTLHKQLKLLIMLKAVFSDLTHFTVAPHKRFIYIQHINVDNSSHDDHSGRAV